MSLPATVEVDDLDELKRLIKKPREMERVSHDLEGKIYRLMQPAEMAHALNALRRRYNVIATVVGMPDELVGRKNTQQRLIAQFVQEQQQHHGLGRGEQVVMWNERKSTMKALAVLREQGVRVDEAIDPRKVAADIKAVRYWLYVDICFY
jgi:RNase H-fold protein (predicted Holliday junction resolvase)